MVKKPNSKRNTAPTRNRQAKDIPVFSLYGETAPVDATEFVHIEEIRARSERYDWHIKPHQHRGLCQILFVRRGAVEVQADGHVEKIKVPCALSMPPAVVHALKFRPGTQGYILTISEAMLPRADRHGLIAALFVEPRAISFAGAPRRAQAIAALLDQIMAEMREQAPERAAMQEWLVSAALLLIARQRASAPEDGRQGRQQRELSRLRTLIEANFLEHWKVSDYAAAMSMTEARLNRLARAVAGKSAFELVQDRLMLEARRKLIYVAAPISALAYELGFEDPAYFSRCFKNRFGVTPSTFRRELE
ncbi:MAG TPA: helix-turn-helix domain-containing protein [Pseudolabrys sp.]|nr:helix-turn-helix domain-containing protein [Pseudolabrys sp.]